MSNKLQTVFNTEPGSYSELRGHWDSVVMKDDRVSYLEISFQNGPVAEHGVNGVQLTEVLKICLARYKMLNRTFPCRENALVITNLQQAIMWDEERTAKRTTAGVEGYDRPTPAGE